MAKTSSRYARPPLTQREEEALTRRHLAERQQEQQRLHPSPAYLLQRHRAQQDDGDASDARQQGRRAGVGAGGGGEASRRQRALGRPPFEVGDGCGRPGGSEARPGTGLVTVSKVVRGGQRTIRRRRRQ